MVGCSNILGSDEILCDLMRPSRRVVEIEVSLQTDLTHRLHMQLASGHLLSYRMKQCHHVKRHFMIRPDGWPASLPCTDMSQEHLVSRKEC